MNRVVSLLARWSASVGALAGCMLLVSGASAPSQSSTSTLPSRIEKYVATHVKPTADERKSLSEGEPVTKLLDADKTTEIAVFGAIWIAAPIRRYIDAVSEIENFERGGAFKVTKRISSPPNLKDFSQ